jgi:hypothetical protein
VNIKISQACLEQFLNGVLVAVEFEKSSVVMIIVFVKKMFFNVANFLGYPVGRLSVIGCIRPVCNRALHAD